VTLGLYIYVRFDFFVEVKIIKIMKKTFFGVLALCT
jgi:hypothetical protein